MSVNEAYQREDDSYILIADGQAVTYTGLDENGDPVFERYGFVLGRGHTAGEEPAAGQLGGNGAFSDGNGGKGGDGGDGGQGGRGGDGGQGGGGAGGTIKLQGSVIAGNGVVVDASGGAGGNTGGIGRLVLAGDDLSFNGSTLGATAIDGVDANLGFFAGGRESNFYTGTDTARIAGLEGRPAPFGIIAGLDTDALLTNYTKHISGLSIDPSALALVIRLDTVPVPLADDRENKDSLTGFDVVLVANLTDVTLVKPWIELGATSSNLRASTGAGITAIDLGPRQVWATLVPRDFEGPVSVSFFGDREKDPSERISEVGQSGAGANDDFFFVDALQPPSGATPPTVPGLDRIAVTADGETVFGLSARADFTAVVVSDGAGQARQLVKTGLGDAPSDIALLEDGGRTILLLADATAGSIRAFDVTSGVLLTDTPATIDLGPGAVDVLITRGDAVFAAGANGVTRLAVGSDGAFSVLSSHAEPADALAAGATHLFAVDTTKATLRAYGIDAIDAGPVATIDAAAVLGLAAASSMAVDADGFVYVGSEANGTLVVLRFSAEGGFTHVQTVRNGADGVRAMRGPSEIRVLDTSAIVASRADDALVVFQKKRDADGLATGELVFVQAVRDGVGAADRLRAPAGLALATVGGAPVLFVASAGDGGRDGGLARLGIATGLPEPIVSATEFRAIEAVSLETGDGNDVLVLNTAPGEDVHRLAIRSTGGDNIVTVLDLVPHDRAGGASGVDSGVLVETGDGADIVRIAATRPLGQLEVLTGEGSDTIFVDAIGPRARLRVDAGGGEDDVFLRGTGIPADVERVHLSGSDPAIPRGDVLFYDPQDPNPNSYVLEGSLQDGGTVRRTGFGLVHVDTFEELRAVAAPRIVSFTAQPTREGEGTSVSWRIESDGSALVGPLRFDLDGDGVYRDMAISLPEGATTAEGSFTLDWAQLASFGIIDDGDFRFGLSIQNEVGTTRADTRLAVENVHPTVFLDREGPEATVGVPFSISFRVTDPGDDTVYLWRVDWGDGTVETFGQGTSAATHVYTARADDRVIRVNAYDEDTPANDPTTEIDESDINFAITTVRVVEPVGGSLRLDGPAPVIAEGETLELVFTSAGGLDLSRITLAFGTTAAPNVPSASVEILGQRARLDWDALQALGIIDEGLYAIRATAPFLGGGEAVAHFSLVVQNTPPSARAVVTATSGNPATPILRGQDALLRMVDLFDPALGDLDLARDDGARLRFSYDLDADGIFDIVNVEATEIVIPGALNPEVGTRDVRIAVSDGTDTVIVLASYEVVATAPRPVVVVTKTQVDENEVFRLEIGPDENDVSADRIVEYLVSWNDQSPDTVHTGPRAVIEHRFQGPGAFAVEILVVGETSTTRVPPLEVRVLNVPPRIVTASITPSDEGSTAVLRGFLEDPGLRDALGLEIDWGDGTSETLVLRPGARDFVATHAYADDGVYTVTLVPFDSTEAGERLELEATVSNVAPRIDALSTGIATIVEGGRVELRGIVSDPGSLDTHVVTIDWGDGSAPVEVAVDPDTRRFGATHVYLDDDPIDDPTRLDGPFGVFRIVATALDKDGGVSEPASIDLTVVNADPFFVFADDGPSSTPQPFDVIASWTPEGVVLEVSGRYDDVGVLDAHVVTIDWGDGSAPVLATVDPGSKSFVARHVYDPARRGSVTIEAVVTDDDTGFMRAVRILELPGPPEPVQTPDPVLTTVPTSQPRPITSLVLPGTGLQFGRVVTEALETRLTVSGVRFPDSSKPLVSPPPFGGRAPLETRALPSAPTMLYWRFDDATDILHEEFAGVHARLVAASVDDVGAALRQPGAEALFATGKSVGFDGFARTAALVDDPAALRGGSGTLQLWFSAARHETGSTLFSIRGGPGEAFVMSLENGFVVLHHRLDGASQEVRSADAIPVERWTHVAATWAGEEIALWVDGTRVAILNAFGGLQRLHGPFVIGADYEPHDDEATHGEGTMLVDHFGGQIDEVAFFDFAFGPDEMARLIAEGPMAFALDADLVDVVESDEELLEAPILP